jgi:hypothetical protein
LTRWLLHNKYSFTEKCGTTTKKTTAKNKFTGEKLEKAFTVLLGQEGFPHHLGITIARKPNNYLLISKLATVSD